ncbi:MAG: pilus assembly protein TadC [Bdellovibrionales bacterium RBG_16_40_8]|nr:MAG: pilus assembly protein TadC [Bdellovibrionales bacterium RBG_16_40_8]
MPEIVLLLAGLGLAALSIYLFTSALLANKTDANALAWASGNEPVKSKSSFINLSRPLVHNFTLQHALRIKNPTYRKKIERKLLTGGLATELNVDEFIGLQILWGVMFPIAMVILKFTMGLSFSYWFCVLMGLGGAYFPHLYCKMQTNQRYISVIVDLPFFIDLLALSTEAGLDFINAIQRIVDKAEDSVLAEELGVVLKDIKLGSSRSDSLKNFARRLDIPEITSFVAVVNDADQTGTSISQVLKDQSTQMRLERFVRAEKAGAKASQLMLLPMVVFILPAVFLVVFAPVILQFFYGGKK